MKKHCLLIINPYILQYVLPVVMSECKLEVQTHNAVNNIDLKTYPTA